MYCKNCGAELDEDTNFCPKCGTSVERYEQWDYTTASTVKQTAEPEEKPAKVWTVFSIIGKILGIVCLATSVIPYVNYASLSFAIAGIVMSCLGRKAQTEQTDNNCRIGLKLSIAAVVVSLVMIVVYLILFVTVLGGTLGAFFESMYELMYY